MSILIPRSSTSTKTKMDKLKQNHRLTSLTTMETIIMLLPNKVNRSTLESTPQLPPHTLPNTLMTNPRQLNPPIPNAVRGSYNLKDPRPNFTPKRTRKKQMITRLTTPPTKNPRQRNRPVPPT